MSSIRAAIRRAFKKATLLHYDAEEHKVYLSDGHWIVILDDTDWPGDLPKASLRDFGNGWEACEPPNFKAAMPVQYGTEDSPDAGLYPLVPANSLPVQGGLIVTNAGEKTEAIVYQTPKGDYFGLSRAFLRQLLDLGCEVRMLNHQDPNGALAVTLRGVCVGALMPVLVERSSVA